ncbi:MAG: hypothetical protein ACOYMP_11180 [Nodosilinea sp.]
MVGFLTPLLSHLQPGAVAGTALWAITAYLACYPRVQRYTDWIYRRLGPSLQDQAPESAADQSPGAAWSGLASLLSVIPLVLLGALTQYGLTLTLGGSWGVSLGVIASMACGIYELGRRDGEASG